MEYLDTNNEPLEIGNHVEFKYRDEVQTGVIYGFTGRATTRVEIHPDEKWYSTNGGAKVDGKKSNSIRLENVTKITQHKGTTVEPTGSANVELKVGSVVIIKSKDDLIEELGADDAGYPLTTTRFNHSGNMDHYFGAAGTITALNSERGYLEIDFETKEPGLNYDWVVSTDMVTLDDGSYIGTTTVREPLRAFLKATPEPTAKQVWTALMALKKKLNWNDGVVLNLIGIFTSRGIEQLRRIVEYTEETAFKATMLPPTIERYELAYPKVNTELLSLTYRLLDGAYGNKPNPQYDAIEELVESLAALKVNSDLKVELSNIPFTPMQRGNVRATTAMVDQVWKHLVIKETYLENGYHSSLESMAENIGSAIVTYLDKTNKLHLTEGDTIEIGA